MAQPQSALAYVLKSPGATVAPRPVASTIKGHYVSVGDKSTASVRVDAGRVFVNGELVPLQSSAPNTLSWSASRPGFYTSGRLSIAPNGSHLTGFLSAGKSPHDAIGADTILYLADEFFDTQLSSDGKTWTPGLLLELALSPGSEPGSPPTWAINLDKTSVGDFCRVDTRTPHVLGVTGEKLADPTVIEVGKSDDLVIVLDGGDGVLLTLDAGSFTPDALVTMLQAKIAEAKLGVAVSQVDGQLNLSTTSTAIDAGIDIGTCGAIKPLHLIRSTKTLEQLTSAQQDCVQFVMNIPPGSFESTPETALLPIRALMILGLEGTTFQGVYVTQDQFGTLNKKQWTGTLRAQPVLAQAVTTALSATPDDDLSLNDLRSLDVTGADEISKNRFQDYIVASCDEYWRTNLLGAGMPAIDPYDAKVLSNCSDFYKNKLCPAFLTYAICRVPADKGGPQNNITPEEIAALRQYWANGLMSEKDYSTLSGQLTQVAYCVRQPKLRSYIDAGTGDDSWASKLYNALNDPPSLVQASLAFSSGNAQHVKQSSELLLALNTDTSVTLSNGTQCTYASGYYNKIFQFMAGHGVASVKLSATSGPSSPQSAARFMVDWITQYCSTYSSATQPADSTLTASEYVQAHELAVKVEGDLQAAGGATLLQTGIVTELAAGASGDGFIASLRKLLTSDTMKKFKSVASVLTMAGYSYGLTCSISALKNWDNLTDEQRAKAIFDTISMSGGLIAKYIQLDPGGLLSKLTQPAEIAGRLEPCIEMTMLSDVAVGEDLTIPLVAKATALSQGEGVGTSTLARVFGETSSYMKAFSVIVALGGVAFSTYSVVSDFENDATDLQKALDIVGDVASLTIAAGAIMEAAGAVGMCAEALGPIGVAALVIIAIIETFAPKPNPPERPADKYLDQTGRAFAQSLLPAK